MQEFCSHYLSYLKYQLVNYTLHYILHSKQLKLNAPSPTQIVEFKEYAYARVSLLVFFCLNTLYMGVIVTEAVEFYIHAK